MGEGLSPLQRGTARAKLAQGVEHEPCSGRPGHVTKIPAGLIPRLALRAEAVPLLSRAAIKTQNMREGLSPLQRGTARAKLAQGVEHEPCCGRS